MTRDDPLRLTTGAKINLFLRVVGRRSDGFHELESIFHSLDLVDDMEVSSRPDGRLEVEMTAEPGSSSTAFPAEEDNIVLTAARRLQEVAVGDHGARIRVHKRIPVGGGMGGGSSNAAGALLALDRLWGLDLERSTLLELAADIGSDVPYCLEGSATALVGGRGEKVAPLPGPPRPLWFVLGISHEPLLTSDVYEALEGPTAEGPSVAVVTLALGEGDVNELGHLLYNDLERPAFALRPRLRDDKEALLEAGALGACLSGSGPTLFGLAPDRDAALALADTVAPRFDRVRVAASARSCINFL